MILPPDAILQFTLDFGTSSKAGRMNATMRVPVAVRASQVTEPRQDSIQAGEGRSLVSDDSKAARLLATCT